MAVSEVPTTSIVLTNESLPILSHPETTSNGTTKGKGKASLFEGPAFLYDEEWTGLDIHTELRAATSVGSATLQVHSTVPDRELEYEELINKSQRLTKIDPNNICHIHGQYLQEPSASGPGKIRWDEKWERRQKNPKERYLGIGSQGSVYLQQCTFRPNHGQYRAVKEIPKKNLVEGYRELEAITFISISEVCHLRSSTSTKAEWLMI